MAYQKGTAANFADLFSQFISFMTTNADLVAASQAWELVFRSAPTSWTGKVTTSVQREHAVLKGPGLAGEDEIYAGITSFGDSALDYYNWRISGMTGFNTQGLIDSYPTLDSAMAGGSPLAVGALLWNQSMPYWFFANGRRFWVVVKVSTLYTSFGAGFILPSVNPGQYPYPLAIWGGYPDSVDRWSSTQDYHRGISNPANQSMFLRQPSGRWADFYGDNVYSTSYVADGSKRRILPCGAGKWGRELSSPATSNYSWNLVYRMRDAPGGVFNLLPLTLMSSGTEGNAIYGEADGAYFVPVLNNGSEDEITINGTKHIVFQSAFRTGSPYLFALRAD